MKLKRVPNEVPLLFPEMWILSLILKKRYSLSPMYSPKRCSLQLLHSYLRPILNYLFSKQNCDDVLVWPMSFRRKRASVAFCSIICSTLNDSFRKKLRIKVSGIGHKFITVSRNIENEPVPPSICCWYVWIIHCNCEALRSLRYNGPWKLWRLVCACASKSIELFCHCFFFSQVTANWGKRFLNKKGRSTKHAKSKQQLFHLHYLVS